MNARDYCRDLILSETLAGKLVAPVEIEFDPQSDPSAPEESNSPVAAESLRAPGRPANLQIVAARAVKVPPIIGMKDKSQRRRILHALANHELQAIELFAWAVLAFPQTPVAFRRGMIAILVEEQRHLELYCDRLAAHDAVFGDFGVTGHFWRQLDVMSSPIEFLCAMGLTFENANLDFAGEYAKAAIEAGDQETADALAIVHRDEERHVHFAYRWLCRFKPESETPLETYSRIVQQPLGLDRARGKSFDKESRSRAGLDEEFIAALEDATARRPSGAPR